MIAGCGAPAARSARPTSTPSRDIGEAMSPAASPPAAPWSAAPSSACPTTAVLDGAQPERQGIGDGATLWALFFPVGPSLTAGKEIKVVWRMTGSGDLSISATGPGGAVVMPQWGPESHNGSSFHRPGDEWGTGWVFPVPGCWTVNARRTAGSASLTIRVAG
jgi:hypothetical protein